MRQEDLRRSEFFGLPWVEEVRIFFMLDGMTEEVVFILLGSCYSRRHTPCQQRHAVMLISICLYCSISILYLVCCTLALTQSLTVKVRDA